MPIRFDLEPAAERPLAPIGAPIGDPIGSAAVSAAAIPSASAPPAAHRLGALSERYESGGRGPGTVSSGRHDPGGVSYGLFQLASRPGTVAAFLRGEGAPWATAFGAAQPGEARFSATWQAVAARDAEAFAEAQRAFVERTHYRPVVAQVAARTGLDLDRRADAVRDVCWSCAVQHGAAARILAAAVGEADRAQPRSAAGYDRLLIGTIYAGRAAYLRDLARRAPPGSRATLLDIAARRYPAELAAALAMLDGAG